MNIDGKKILITGADGFIGSHLVERMLQEKCEIRAFVYYNSFNSWGWLDTLPQEKLDKIEVFTGDIRDANAVRTVLKDINIVCHLALFRVSIIFLEVKNHICMQLLSLREISLIAKTVSMSADSVNIWLRGI